MITAKEEGEPPISWHIRRMAEPHDGARDRLIAQGRLKPATDGRDALLASLAPRLATEPGDDDDAGTAALLAMRDDERY
jgi:hypothetical protein